MARRDGLACAGSIFTPGQILAKMRCQKLVDDGSRRRIEDLNPTVVMTIDDSVLAHAQAPQAIQASLKRPNIALVAG